MDRDGRPPPEDRLAVVPEIRDLPVDGVRYGVDGRRADDDRVADRRRRGRRTGAAEAISAWSSPSRATIPGCSRLRRSAKAAASWRRPRPRRPAPCSPARGTCSSESKRKRPVRSRRPKTDPRALQPHGRVCDVGDRPACERDVLHRKRGDDRTLAVSAPPHCPCRKMPRRRRRGQPAGATRTWTRE